MKKLVYLGLIVLVFSTSACQSTAGANAQSSSNAELRNTLWKLTELGGKTVLTQEAQRMASLTLASEESRARIVTACNSGSASFTVDGKSLKFAAVMATKYSNCLTPIVKNWRVSIRNICELWLP